MKKITIRASRVMVVAGLVASCWFAGGAQSQCARPADDVKKADLGQRLGLSDFTVQDITVDVGEAGEQLPKEFAFDLVIGGEQKRIILQQHNLGPDMVVLEQLADGSIRYVPPMPARTYQGVIDGEAESSVAASVTPGGGLTGMVFRDDEVWGFQPVSDVEPGADPRAHAVYRQSDVVFPHGVCGVVTEDDHRDPLEHGDEGGVAGSGFSGGVTVDIAFDADFEFFQLNGSSIPNTAADITAVLNGVDAMYRREVGIAFRITTILVRTAEPDPYTSSIANNLLVEFQNHWNAVQGGIVRDHAQLMTGKNLGGTIGIAFLNTICSAPGSSYSVVQSRWQSVFAGRVSLSGHEIGHSFNALHCNAVPATCGMMCSGIDSCPASMLSIDPANIANIIAKRNSAQCLAALAPRGSCCIGSTCTQTAQSQCLALGGTWTLNLPCATRSSYSASPGLAIPDNNLTGVTTIINVPDSFTISDLNVRLNIPHTYVGDLVVELSHDGVTFRRIIDRMGHPQVNFGCFANNLNLWLDDEGTGGPIEALCSIGGPMCPISGPSFVPQNTLAFFDGQNASGTWTLRVIDQAPPDAGSITSWTLDFERAGTSVCVPTGSCCVGSNCTQNTQAQCNALGGTWTQGQACFTDVAFTANPNLAIPDGPPAGVSHVLNVPGNFTISDLNLGLVINHTWVGDLIVRLQHGATIVTLIDRPGLPAFPMFGCDGNNYNIVLDDEGTGGSIENLCTFGGVNPTSPPNYTPNNPLSAFDGQNINGNWTITVSDVVASDVGTLVSWRLIAPDPATGVCTDCPADIDNNGFVDVDDLVAVILTWGCTIPPGPCPADVNNDGVVDVDDLVLVILAWGAC